MSGQTVTQAYLLGIREGRATLRGLESQGFTVDRQLARDVLANVKECLAMGFSGDMRDMMRGERDFWAGQVKRLALQQVTQ